MMIYIGKIIGMILVGLLGAMLLLLLLVILVPIRYAVQGNYDTAIHAQAKVTWLLHLFSIRMRYEKTSHVSIRLLGIPIFDSVRAAQKAEKKAAKEAEKTQREAEKAPKEVKKTQEPIETTEPIETPEEDAVFEEQVTSQDIPPKELSLLKKWKHFLYKCTHIKYTIKQICDRIKNAIEEITYYNQVLHSEIAKQAFMLCKKQLLFLWNHCKPKKYQIYLHLGMEDPATMGMIMSYYGMFYPLYTDHVMIAPDFEQIIIEGHGYLKGRITIGMLLRMAWIIFFDKNLRRFIRICKKEEIYNG
ncbi:MAG: hypothetical protein RRX92_03280 [Lachnospiraceae bacterium]